MAQLPSGLQEQLRKTIFEVFARAWDALEPVSTELTAVEEAVLACARDLVAAAAREKYAAVAQAARLENDRASWMNRLPDELWCSIWDQLPFVDRFIATTVCARWKRTMQALPSLWTRLHFCTYYQRGAPNAGALPRILALSRDLPLDVTIQTSPLRPAWDRFVDIMGPLQPGARIARLFVRSGHVDASSFLLRHFSVLPMLREFVTERLPVVREGRYFVFPFWPPNVQLPALERLHLAQGYAWPEDLHRLPSVRELHITPRQDLEAELRTALFGCPQLRTLRVDLCMHPFEEPFDPTCEPLQDLAAPCLQSVELMNLPATGDDEILSLCHNPSWRELALTYRSCNGAIPRSWAVLRSATVDLDGAPVNVLVAYSDDYLDVLSVRISGSHCVRSVAVADCDNPSIYVDDLARILAEARCRVKLTVDVASPHVLSELQPSLAQIMALQ